MPRLNLSLTGFGKRLEQSLLRQPKLPFAAQHRRRKKAPRGDSTPDQKLRNPGSEVQPLVQRFLLFQENPVFPLAEVAGRSGLGPEGRRFESFHPDYRKPQYFLEILRFFRVQIAQRAYPGLLKVPG